MSHRTLRVVLSTEVHLLYADCETIDDASELHSTSVQGSLPLVRARHKLLILSWVIQHRATQQLQEQGQACNSLVCTPKLLSLCSQPS